MMTKTLTEVGAVLLCVFFTATGALMLVSPGTYFRWVSRVGPRRSHVEGTGRGGRWLAFELWTRVRGLLLLAAMAWVAYQGYIHIR
ncbi:hypothetical protein [Edaphobacter sp.]|uniref:hypothetical protein n=1 Tax=Edaphobacter sp. TaxID=1934404 RepID=UPI002DBA8CA0|nr:hypothetical protein [Edaphobacter sp.]HEU5341561.1 hypothetical protein [Edaphobacter sp.]